jgi:hypothetical protein
VTLLVVLASAGCSLSGAAVRRFARDESCPEDRVVVRRRADMRPSSAIPRTQPPADVAADPERLRVWESTRQDERDLADLGEIYEVEGCGVGRLYTCHRTKGGSYCSQ